MDLLKFQCEYFDEDHTNAKLVISTVNRLDIKYIANIENFQSCQLPKNYLTNEICALYIIDSINSDVMSYKYEESTDSIIINIEINKMYYIEIILHRDDSVKIDLQSEINKLKLKLDELTTDELISTHMYPSWSSLDEFKQLPDFKYFQAVEDHLMYYQQKTIMYKSDPNKQYKCNLNYIGIYKEKYYYVINNSNRSSYDEYTIERYLIKDDTPSDIKLRYYPNPDSIMYPTFLISMHPDLSKIPNSDRDRLLLSSIETPFNISDYKYFKQGVTQINNGPVIFAWVTSYIKTYLYGWILLNKDLIIARKSYAKVIIKNNKCEIQIWRSKKTQISTRMRSIDDIFVIDLDFDGIKEVVIDDDIHDIGGIGKLW